ncbi:CBS domain protein [Necator americanus]|uniref:CBS domain protein n=1 Tax=Necator americanus TaxID=51031 RepID=W2SJH6_NECAM|nr:CBS domain protein [Necator americanus]ETN69041.1 CBS domain protein [Necator americanus]
MAHSQSVSPLRSHLTIGPHSQSLRGPSRTPQGHAHTYSVREKSVGEILHYEADSYARLLQMNQCYEAMPTSSKMVVFDTELVLWKAFNGLVYQNTRHVLLSNGEQGGLITGILSVTDFIRVMLRLHRERGNSDALADEKEDIGKLTIQKYRELVQKEGKLKELVYINANSSLLEAARLLAQHRIHRLPVLDPESGSPLFILTHKRLLKFLWCFITVFIQDSQSEKDRVVSVRDTDTLWKAITVLVERNVHRLCAVNEKGAIEGIISLSDVINHMVVKPGANLKPIRAPPRHHSYHTVEQNEKELRHRLQDSAMLLEDTATGKLQKDFNNMTIR